MREPTLYDFLGLELDDSFVRIRSRITGLRIEYEIVDAAARMTSDRWVVPPNQWKDCLEKAAYILLDPEERARYNQKFGLAISLELMMYTGDLHLDEKIT